MSIVKFDANGNEVIEGIKEIVEVEVAVNAALTDFVVSVPRGSFGAVIKRIPSTITEARAKVNNQVKAFLIDEGDKISPFSEGIASFKISTLGTHATEKIVIQFII